MASNEFSIRCKTENGIYTLDELNGDCTIRKLKKCLGRLTQIKPEAMKILFGYPPQAVIDGSDSLTLSDISINSGDTVIMEIVEVPEDSVKKNRVLPGIMLRHVVPSNNSCLFASMLFNLGNGEVDFARSDELRSIIASVVEEYSTKYNAAFLGMGNSEYCDWIRDVNHWGGAIELSILSEHFNVEIVAVDTVNLKLHRFGEIEEYNHRVFLIYDGIHYDPLLIEHENKKQTIFPTDELKLLDMAMEIAKEAKSSRQFTDVANFTVCCQTCKVKLVGDKEARQHALETGHTDYGEI